MPNPDNAEVQKWEDVNAYTSGATCHICTSTEQVKTGRIPDKTIDFSIPEVLTVGTVSWNLCENCHLDGWTPPANKFLGKYAYFKYYSGGAKIKVV